MKYKNYIGTGASPFWGLMAIVWVVASIVFFKTRQNNAIQEVTVLKNSNEKVSSTKVKSPLIAPVDDDNYSLDEVNGIDIDKPLNLNLSKMYDENELFEHRFAKFGFESIDDINLLLENGKKISFLSNEIDENGIDLSYTDKANFPYESKKQVYLKYIRFSTKMYESHEAAMLKAKEILVGLGTETHSLSNWFANRYGNNTLQNPEFLIFKKGTFIKRYTRYTDAVVFITLKSGVDDKNYENAIIEVEIYFKTK